jgi:hypothetical protein
MIATTLGSPPTRYVKMVAPAVPHPGHTLGTTAKMQKRIPHGFQKRAKPATAVSPVASV